MSKISVFLMGASIAFLSSAVFHAQAAPDAKDAIAVHPATASTTAAAANASISPVTTGAAANDDVAAQLVKLQTEVMLLKAQTAKAQAQAELEKASAGNVDDGGGKSGARGDAKSGGSSSGLPEVTSIYGRDQALVATLRLHSGGVMEARVGDALPGGYRLTRIAAGSVTFTRGGRQFVAGLSAPAVLPSVQGGGPLMLAPPLPRRD